MSWFAKARQDWIGETLYVFGYINRQHIERKFQITTAVASKDLQQFMADNPTVMKYNKVAKRYEFMVD